MPLSGFLVKMALLTNFWNLSESVHKQLLFTDFSFIFVASYIELPFMILPIFNVLDDMDNNLINASYDLGADQVGDLPPCHLPSIDERRAKWSSVGLYSQLESLHANTFDWWESRYYAGNGY